MRTSSAAHPGSCSTPADSPRGSSPTCWRSARTGRLPSTAAATCASADDGARSRSRTRSAGRACTCSRSSRARWPRAGSASGPGWTPHGQPGAPPAGPGDGQARVHRRRPGDGARAHGRRGRMAREGRAAQCRPDVAGPSRRPHRVRRRSPRARPGALAARRRCAGTSRMSRRQRTRSWRGAAGPITSRLLNLHAPDSRRRTAAGAGVRQGTGKVGANRPAQDRRHVAPLTVDRCSDARPRHPCPGRLDRLRAGRQRVPRHARRRPQGPGHLYRDLLVGLAGRRRHDGRPRAG